MKLNKLLIATLAVFLFIGTAHAGTLWQEFDNSTLTGYIANNSDMLEGDAPSVFENIAVYEPGDETMFGIPMKLARHRLVMQGDEVIVNDLMLIGSIGDSDTFYLSYRDDCGGVMYNVTQHWNEKLPPILLGAYLGNGGKLGASLYGEWIIADGYFIHADLMYFRDSDNKTEPAKFKANGKFAGVHNFKPDGSVYGEIFLMYVNNKPLYGGGVGYKF